MKIIDKIYCIYQPIFLQKQHENSLARVQERGNEIANFTQVKSDETQ